MKVWTITLCHNDPDIIRDSIAQYYATKSPLVATNHILVHQHWPVGKSAVKAKLEAIARDYGCLLMDPGKNLGLHEGFNWAWRQQAIPDNAMVIGYDPDSWPLDQDWDMAMCRVFVERPDVGWLSLWHTHCDRQVTQEGAGEAHFEASGVKVVPVRRAVMNSICGFRQSWLRQTEGLYEGNAYYGGLEVAMWQKLAGRRWVFLPEYREDLRMHDRVDPTYREYKWRHAHVRDFQGSFEEFVSQHRPHLLS